MEGIPCEDFPTCAVAQFQNAKVPKNAKQQDGYFVVEDVGTTFQVSLPIGPLSVFGVMDGHGQYGEVCANFIRKALPHQLAMSEALGANQLKQASTEAVLRTEYLLRWAETLPLYCSGSCVTMVAVTASTIVCANAGDCRAVLAYESQTTPGEWDYRNLSNDHNVANATEEEVHRIVNAGAQLTLDDRLTCPGAPGSLQTTHALGDFWAKPEGRPEMVSSEPEVIEVARHEGQKMLIVCSDGVFSKLSSRQVVKLAHSVAAQAPNSPLSRIAHAIICAAVDLGSDDNCTCMIIALPRLHASVCQTVNCAEPTGKNRVAGSEAQMGYGIHAPLYAKPGIRLGTPPVDPKNKQFPWQNAEYTMSYGGPMGDNDGGALLSNGEENLSSCRGKVRLQWATQRLGRENSYADKRWSQLVAEETNRSGDDAVPPARVKPIVSECMEDARRQFPRRSNGIYEEAHKHGEPIKGEPHVFRQAKMLRRTSKKADKPQLGGPVSEFVRKSSEEFSEMRGYLVYTDDAQDTAHRINGFDESVENAQQAKRNTDSTYNESRSRKQSVDNGFHLGTDGNLESTMHIGVLDGEQKVCARKVFAPQSDTVPNREAWQDCVGIKPARYGGLQEGLVLPRNAMNEYKTEKQQASFGNLCSELGSRGSVMEEHDTNAVWKRCNGSRAAHNGVKNIERNREVMRQRNTGDLYNGALGGHANHIRTCAGKWGIDMHYCDRMAAQEHSHETPPGGNLRDPLAHPQKFTERYKRNPRDVTPPNDRPKEWRHDDNVKTRTRLNGTKARDTVMRYTKSWRTDENVPELQSTGSDCGEDTIQRKAQAGTSVSLVKKYTGGAWDPPSSHQSAVHCEVDGHHSGCGNRRTIMPRKEFNAKGMTEWRSKRKLHGLSDPVLFALENQMGNN